MKIIMSQWHYLQLFGAVFVVIKSVENVAANVVG
jgi:hypothetical protein